MEMPVRQRWLREPPRRQNSTGMRRQVPWLMGMGAWEVCSEVVATVWDAIYKPASRVASLTTLMNMSHFRTFVDTLYRLV